MRDRRIVAVAAITAALLSTTTLLRTSSAQEESHRIKVESIIGNGLKASIYRSNDSDPCAFKFCIQTRDTLTLSQEERLRNEIMSLTQRCRAERGLPPIANMHLRILRRYPYP